MTPQLNGFKKLVDDLRFQIIENWCLCKYCQLYDQTNDNYRYWLSEFITYSECIREFETNLGLDKVKTISKMFIDDYDYNQERKALFIIREKFDALKINDMSKRNEIATKFVHSLNGLIEVLAGTQASIDDYVQATFQYKTTA